MMIFSRKSTTCDDCEQTLTLDFDSRQKSRLKARLDDGTEAGIILERGLSLYDGDILESEDGSLLRIVAADEELSTVSTDDPLLMARCCYHLGNRHVPLQIAAGRLYWQKDHVLDEMIQSLGLQVSHEQGPFQPEHGAYHHHAH